MCGRSHHAPTQTVSHLQPPTSVRTHTVEMKHGNGSPDDSPCVFVPFPVSSISSGPLPEHSSSPSIFPPCSPLTSPNSAASCLSGGAPTRPTATTVSSSRLCFRLFTANNSLITLFPLAVYDTQQLCCSCCSTHTQCTHNSALHLLPGLGSNPFWTGSELHFMRNSWLKDTETAEFLSFTTDTCESLPTEP